MLFDVIRSKGRIKVHSMKDKQYTHNASVLTALLVHSPKSLFLTSDLYLGRVDKQSKTYVRELDIRREMQFQGGGSDVVSVSCFGVKVSVMFHFMFVHYTFSSVWVAEWPPFGK